MKNLSKDWVLCDIKELIILLDTTQVLVSLVFLLQNAWRNYLVKCSLVKSHSKEMSFTTKTEKLLSQKYLPPWTAGLVSDVFLYTCELSSWSLQSVVKVSIVLRQGNWVPSSNPSPSSCCTMTLSMSVNTSEIHFLHNKLKNVTLYDRVGSRTKRD